jgi:hypothetical protein
MIVWECEDREDCSRRLYETKVRFRMLGRDMCGGRVRKRDSTNGGDGGLTVSVRDEDEDLGG